MNKVNKDLTNAGMAGVAVGAVVGVATTMILSDKKRREEIMMHAGKLKKDLVDTSLKFRDDKAKDIDTAVKQASKSDVVNAVEEKVTDTLK